MIIEKWMHDIDEITKEVIQSFGKLDNDQLNFKFNSATWSIAQNIEHLIVINETYFPVFDSLKKGNYCFPLLGRFGFLVRFFGKMIYNAVKPGQTKKTKTFPIWEPAKSSIDKDLLNRFEQHQLLLKKHIFECKDLFGKHVVISSPAKWFIVYTLDCAFEIIIAHEQRHLEQAKAILFEQYKKSEKISD